MAKPLDERIAAAKARRDREAARLIQLTAKAKQADRKLETRRKIVIGAAVMTEMARNPRFADHVRTMLGREVTRPQDREAIAFLIDPATPLPPKPVVRVQAAQNPPEPPAALPPALPAEPQSSPEGASPLGARPANDWRPRHSSLSEYAAPMLRR